MNNIAKTLGACLAGFSAICIAEPGVDTSLMMKTSYLPCLEQPELQKMRADELKQMLVDDQAIREKWDEMTENDIVTMLDEDLARRKRVGEILGEGCFKTPEDYMAAALIYQHGDTPDHYYQAFVWSNRAVELGDEKQKHFVALTIDRYLVSKGNKQLFGSQAFTSNLAAGCYCLQQVETSFPDARRQQFSGVSLQERYEWVSSLNQGKNCPVEIECDVPLKATPAGSVPGFW